MKEPLPCWSGRQQHRWDSNGWLFPNKRALYLFPVPRAGNPYYAIEVFRIEETLPMWLLVIILLSPVPDADQVTVLKSFATYEECQPEGDRVGLEMADSYPYDHFRIICAFRALPQLLVRHVQ